METPPGPPIGETLDKVVQDAAAGAAEYVMDYIRCDDTSPELVGPILVMPGLQEVPRLFANRVKHKTKKTWCKESAEMQVAIVGELALAIAGADGDIAKYIYKTADLLAPGQATGTKYKSRGYLPWQPAGAEDVEKVGGLTLFPPGPKPNAAPNPVPNPKPWTQNPKPCRPSCTTSKRWVHSFMYD